MYKHFLGLVLVMMLPLCSIAQQKDSLYYTAVDKAPEFPGGMDGLLGYLRTIKTYREDLDEGLTGRMVATFIITEKGKIRDVKLVRAFGSRMEKDFVRLIKAMPDWKPAMLRGRAVPYKYTVPLQVCFRGE